MWALACGSLTLESFSLDNALPELLHRSVLPAFLGSLGIYYPRLSRCALLVRLGGTQAREKRVQQLEVVRS